MGFRGTYVYCLHLQGPTQCLNLEDQSMKTYHYINIFTLMFTEPTYVHLVTILVSWMVSKVWKYASFPAAAHTDCIYMDWIPWFSSYVFSQGSKNWLWNDYIIKQILLYKGGRRIDGTNETSHWCQDTKQNKTTDDCGVYTLLLSTHQLTEISAWLLDIITSV